MDIIARGRHERFVIIKEKVDQNLQKKVSKFEDNNT